MELCNSLPFGVCAVYKQWGNTEVKKMERAELEKEHNHHKLANKLNLGILNPNFKGEKFPTLSTVVPKGSPVESQLLRSLLYGGMAGISLLYGILQQD